MIIYKPKGKALEYSPLAANLFKGCSHGCTYCFAPSATFTDRKLFSSPEYIEPRKNILLELDKSAKRLKNDPRPILFSFTSDLYQPANDIFKLSRTALLSLSENNLTTTVLTKGGTKACKDFDILSRNKKNSFGVTLTTDNPDESIKWEPGAALPADRIESLKQAKKAGINTWVSFEPVINPKAVIRLIEETHSFVDLYKVGKLNYHPFAKTIDWKSFLFNVEDTLNKYNCKRYIKKDLETYRFKTAAK